MNSLWKGFLHLPCEMRQKAKPKVVVFFTEKCLGASSGPRKLLVDNSIFHTKDMPGPILVVPAGIARCPSAITIRQQRRKKESFKNNLLLTSNIQERCKKDTRKIQETYKKCGVWSPPVSPERAEFRPGVFIEVKSGGFGLHSFIGEFKTEEWEFKAQKRKKTK